MMETSSSNNPNISLDTTINNDYIKPKSNQKARVIQWDPHMGTDQSTITVVLEQPVSDSINAMNEINPMRLVFGQLVVDTNQQHQRVPNASSNTTMNSQLMWITLVAHVPSFLDTKVVSGNQVPVSICVYDRSNLDTAIDHYNIGMFTYNKNAGENELSKKRPSTDALMNELPSKRPSLEDDQLFNQLLAPFDDSPVKHTLPVPEKRHNTSSLVPQSSSLFNQMSAPSSYHSSSNNNPFLQQAHPYNRYSTQPQQQQQQMHSQLPVHMEPSASQIQYSSYGTSSNMSYPHSDFSSQQSSYGLGTSVPNTSSSPIYQSYSQQTQPLYNSQPQMVLPVPTSSASGSSVGPNNILSLSSPFAGVLSKANLKITGDLMEMTWNWTPDEWAHGRRLVQFWRRQNGDMPEGDVESIRKKEENEVECGFEPISQEAYQQQRIRENLSNQKHSLLKKSNSLVVSCIHWQEKNDYFITSVDCIYLLEGIIGVQFTVEEKNRIRRNLEGFRPLTVSKCKPECAEFFKLIMSFPHPKPRNIEKDVKVFPWKTLPNALRKIIRKYTPSYSSTALVNLNN